MIDFPKDFIDYVSNDHHLGEGLLNSLNEVPPVSLRKNPRKIEVEFDGERSNEWCENAVFLPSRPSYTLNPLFHAGAFYPQEAGSMFLDTVLRSLKLSDEPKILDLCAAPGGKSTLIASFLDGRGYLVANEVINQRAKILKENISKWGYANTIVTNNDPSDFSRLTSFFDVVVVDAPCSGEGMFRKDEQARNEWSMDNVKLCAARQRRIVADVWDSLNEGGFLIYSTCTFNPYENEENVQWIMDNLGGEYMEIVAPEQFVNGRGGIGNYGIPGRSETEGFYIAAIRKTSGAGKRASLGRNANKGLVRVKDTSELKAWVDVTNSSFFTWNGMILAAPTKWEKDFLVIQDNLHIVKWGVVVGEEARKGLIPDHDLLMSHQLRLKYATYELTEQEALFYLHGDTFTLQNDVNNGFVSMSFNGEPLGWIKNIGNRFNNLYPKEFRIRMRVDDKL